MSKIAIPTRDDVVDDHFGNCDHYTIFSLNDTKQIASVESFKAPEGCGCKSDIASVLKAEGVDTMIAGNMGNGALNKLKEAGIEVIRGCSGNVGLLAHSFLQGNLSDSGESCTQHGADHECSH